MAVSAAAAIVLSIAAGLQPAYSKGSPQRVNISYLEYDHAPAMWIADTSWKAVGTEPIPKLLVTAGGFRLAKDVWHGVLPGDGYVAPAGAALYPLPQLDYGEGAVSDGTRRVELTLHASAATTAVFLMIPKDAQLVRLEFRGQRLETKGYVGPTRLICLGSDCSLMQVSLVLRNKDSNLIAVCRGPLRAAGERQSPEGRASCLGHGIAERRRNRPGERRRDSADVRRSRCMSDRGFRTVAVSALLVVLFGMFAGGIPLIAVVVHDAYGQPGALHLPGDYRGWMMAHLEGLLNGLLMIAIATVTRMRPLAPKSERWLVLSLLAAGWGNAGAAVLAPLLGVRGMVFDANVGNDLVAAIFTVALAGSVIAMAIALRHLFARI